MYEVSNIQKNNMNRKQANTISRRNFIKNASSAAALGTVSLTGINCGGGMKYRKLGRTGIRSSVINSEKLPDRKMYSMAIEAGVNYWHKMGKWGEPGIFTKLDRDSFYCDLTIDSVEKDPAIEEFERGLKTSGLSMIDGFKVHSVYEHPEDIRSTTGIIQAFETLRKQGKTRFLMLSQHKNVVDIMDAAIESDLFDVIQIPVHPLAQYGSKGPNSEENQTSTYSLKDYLALIKKASDKNIGITSMKTLVGGPKNWEDVPNFRDRVGEYLPENSNITHALIHWALSVPGVCTFASNMRSYEMFIENISAVGEQITEREEAGLKRFSLVMGGHFCRMCGMCESKNPRGVAVSDILRYSMYYKYYGDSVYARALYSALPKNARVKDGKDLERYEKACPYGLPVAQMLRNAHKILV